MSKHLRTLHRMKKPSRKTAMPISPSSPGDRGEVTIASASTMEPG